MEKYDSYKDSGIEWLEEIPSHWETCSVRTFAQEYVEKNKPEKTRELLALSFALGVTLYRDKQFNMDRVKENYEEYKIVHENVLVLSPNDIIKGSVYVSKYYGCISPMYLTLKSRNDDPTCLYYLSYLLRTKQAGRKFFSIAKGLIGSILDNGKYVTRRMSVSRYDLLTFKVIMPPVEEQKAIVNYLDLKLQKIDQLIAFKEREIALYREYIESLIFSRKDLNEISIGAWNSAFDNSVDLIAGKNLFEEIIVKGVNDARFLAVTQDRGLIYKDTDEVNFVTASNKETQKLVNPGQFVISLRSFEGGIEYSDKRGLISAAYVVLQIKDPYNYEEMRQFYRFLLKSKPFVERLSKISDSMRDGKSIKFKDIHNYLFPIPQDESLQEIYKFIRIYDTKVEAFRREYPYLQEYKNRLIADAVTGKFKVC